MPMAQLRCYLTQSCLHFVHVYGDSRVSRCDSVCRAHLRVVRWGGGLIWKLGGKLHRDMYRFQATVHRMVSCDLRKLAGTVLTRR